MAISRILKLTNRMNPAQKKWFALAISIAIVFLGSALIDSGINESNQAAAQQRATNAAATFMKQGDGHVRKLRGGDHSNVSALPDTTGAVDAKQ